MEQVAKSKKTWNVAPVLQVVQKIPENIVLAYIYQLAKFGELRSCGSKDIFKLHLVSCTNAYHMHTHYIHYIYIYIERESNLYQNDKEVKQSYKVLRVSCKRVLQSSACT